MPGGSREVEEKNNKRVACADFIVESASLNIQVSTPNEDFSEVVQLISSARHQACQAVNTALIELYWHPGKVSAALVQQCPDALSVLKDSYVVDFLNLTQDHHEIDLHRGLLTKLKLFLLELGRDFCFVGSEFPIQVGKQDFALDLLFFRRSLNALVAIELKVERFQLEHLGKLNFYRPTKNYCRPSCMSFIC